MTDKRNEDNELLKTEVSSPSLEILPPEAANLRRRVMLDMYNPDVVKNEIASLVKKDNSFNVYATSLEDVESSVISRSWSIQSLRSDQNVAFVSSTLETGVRYAKDGDFKKAEACYKSILDLSPDCTECLVAYGALCANICNNGNDRSAEAIRYLQMALEIDSQCPNAQIYLDKILARYPQKKAMLALNEEKTSTAEESCYLKSSRLVNDVLVEQSFLDEDRSKEKFSNDDEDVTSKNSHDSKRKRKKSKKNSNSGKRSSRDTRREKKQKKSRKRRHSKRKRRYRSSSTSSEC